MSLSIVLTDSRPWNPQSLTRYFSSGFLRCGHDFTVLPDLLLKLTIRIAVLFAP
jgi:hypothetical protein